MALSYREGPFFCDPSSEELEESDSSSDEVSSTSDSDSSSLSLPAAQKREACRQAWGQKDSKGDQLQQPPLDLSADSQTK